jgi:hypothetical protein
MIIKAPIALAKRSIAEVEKTEISRGRRFIVLAAHGVGFVEGGSGTFRYLKNLFGGFAKLLAFFYRTLTW